MKGETFGAFPLPVPAQLDSTRLGLSDIATVTKVGGSLGMVIDSMDGDSPVPIQNKFHDNPSLTVSNM